MGGILLRTLFLTSYPTGVNADEAYAGYEAYALLNSGIDSHGYAFPVYFISWGSGMNVLYSYLSMLAIGIGGLSVLTIRITQAIVGCLSLLAFFFLLEEVKDRHFALCGMFLLAINPWHIMMSRWGLESNMAPAMILFGVLFLVKALQKSAKYYIPALLFLGAGLYAYAVMWAFIPLFLLLGLAYGIYYKKIKISRYLVIGIGILILLGIPLLLFVGVNKGIIPEIKTSWFSIPQMGSMRDSEISFSNIGGKLKALLSFLAFQVDRDTYNTSNVGIYYYCSIPFMLIGMVEAVISFVKNLRTREFKAADVMLLWFGAAFATGCLISYVNVNKINCIHFPMIYFGVNGCMICIRRIKQFLVYPIVAIYLGFFLVFAGWYFNAEKVDFFYGYEDALSYADQVTDGDIGVVCIRYSAFLLHSQILPEDFLPQVGNEKNYDVVYQIGRYVQQVDMNDLNPDIIYVMPKYLEEQALEQGFETIYDNGNYVVVK